MSSRDYRRFDLELAEAARLQNELSESVLKGPPLDLGQVSLVAGADASYRRGDRRMFAAVVVLSYPSLEVVEERWGYMPVRFPYVPGLLAFREAPALLPLFEKLSRWPDVVLFDGHGIAHPRRAGIASHMGVVLGLPSIGVAKSVLVGSYSEPAQQRACRSPLVHDGVTIGLALRTRDSVKPVFVSIGHMVDLDSAARMALGCCAGYRLPEPIRAAHRLSNSVRQMR